MSYPLPPRYPTPAFRPTPFRPGGPDRLDPLGLHIADTGDPHKTLDLLVSLGVLLKEGETYRPYLPSKADLADGKVPVSQIPDLTASDVGALPASGGVSMARGSSLTILPDDEFTGGFIRAANMYVYDGHLEWVPVPGLPDLSYELPAPVTPDPDTGVVELADRASTYVEVSSAFDSRGIELRFPEVPDGRGRDFIVVIESASSGIDELPLRLPSDLQFFVHGEPFVVLPGELTALHFSEIAAGMFWVRGGTLAQFTPSYPPEEVG